MNATALLVSFFLACGSHGQVRDTTRHFRIPVPELESSGTSVLVLHDVSVPNNRPVTLRAYAVAPDSSRILLGSGGLPAIAPDAKGSTTHPMIRISVTSGLRRWLEMARGATQVDIEVKTEVLPDTAGPIPWSVGRAELVPAQ